MIVKELAGIRTRTRKSPIRTRAGVKGTAAGIKGQSHQGQARDQRSSGSPSHRGSDRSSHPSSEDADLKRREYRDEKGEVHHHTRTYMEQHGGKSDK